MKPGISKGYIPSPLRRESGNARQCSHTLTTFLEGAGSPANNDRCIYLEEVVHIIGIGYSGIVTNDDSSWLHLLGTIHLPTSCFSVSNFKLEKNVPSYVPQVVCRSRIFISEWQMHVRSSQYFCWHMYLIFFLKPEQVQHLISFRILPLNRVHRLYMLPVYIRLFCLE